jgi:hypothetical protein
MPDATHGTDDRQLELWSEAAATPPGSAAPTSPSPPYAPGSRTSAAAAASVAHLTQGMRARVLAHIVGCRSRGATREEVSEALSMKIQTVSARCSELLKKGLVIERGIRLTSSRRPAAVLVATREG